MKFITSLALATSLSAPAFAGGLAQPTPEPVVAVAYAPPVSADWTGFYAGAQIGYGDVSGDLPAGISLDGNGAIGGVHAGYRYDYGQFVTGIELAYNAANIDLGAVGELDSVTQLKVMGGYDLGNALVYATAGGAHAKATVGGADLSENGWLIGIGMDYALTDAWTIGGEITHHRFDNFGGSGADVRANLVQVKVGYKF